MTHHEINIGKKYSLPSRVLREERPYWVYLPDSYDKANKKLRYPVLYLLDGNAFFQADSGVVQFMSSGINGNCQIPEMMIVAIPNTNRTRDLTPSHTTIGHFGDEDESLASSGGAEAFLKFMREELFPHIDSRFQTLPSRILVGHSFGGLLTIHTLLKQPEMFQAYIAMDPSLWWDDEVVTRDAQSKIKTIRKLRKTLYISAANTPAMLPGRKSKMRKAIQNFVKTLEPARSDDFRLGFQYFSSEDHASVHLLSLYHGLLHIFEGFKQTGLESLPALRARFQYWSKLLGGDILPAENYVNGMGYAMMRLLNDVEQAIALFEYNISNFPRSANAYDSLGEAYMIKGDTAQAVKNYKRSLKLDPNNQNAARFIQALQGKKRIPRP